MVCDDHVGRILAVEREQRRAGHGAVLGDERNIVPALDHRRKGDREADLSARQAREPVILLRGCSGFDQGKWGEDGSSEKRHRGRCPAELLGNDRRIEQGLGAGHLERVDLTVELNLDVGALDRRGRCGRRRRAVAT